MQSRAEWASEQKVSTTLSPDSTRQYHVTRIEHTATRKLAYTRAYAHTYIQTHASTHTRAHTHTSTQHTRAHTRTHSSLDISLYKRETLTYVIPDPNTTMPHPDGAVVAVNCLDTL